MSRFGSDQSVEGLDQCRLTAAGMTDQADKLARQDLQIDIL